MSSFSPDPSEPASREPSVPRSSTNPFAASAHKSKTSASPEWSTVPLGVPQLPPLPALPDALTPTEEAKQPDDATTFVPRGEAARAMKELQKALDVERVHQKGQVELERRIHQTRIESENRFHQHRLELENDHYLKRCETDGVGWTHTDTVATCHQRLLDASYAQHEQDMLAHVQQHERDAKDLEQLRMQVEKGESERKGWTMEKAALIEQVVQVKAEKNKVVNEMARQRAAIEKARARTAELKAETSREEDEIERSLLEELDGNALVDGLPSHLVQAIASPKTRFIGPIYNPKSTSPPRNKTGSGSPSSSDGAASSGTHSTSSSPSHKRSSPSTSPEPFSGSPGKKHRGRGMASAPFVDQTRPGTA